MSATVLCVKQYPNEEVAIMLHNTPTVILLRNVKIFTHSTPLEEVRFSNQEKVSDVHFREMREGMHINVVDIGVWNVQTKAMHCAKVVLPIGGVVANISHDGDNVRAVGCTFKSGSESQNVVTLPKRRKHCTSMC
jgi:hypothetical protein